MRSRSGRGPCVDGKVLVDANGPDHPTGVGYGPDGLQREVVDRHVAEDVGLLRSERAEKRLLAGPATEPNSPPVTACAACSRPTPVRGQVKECGLRLA